METPQDVPDPDGHDRHADTVPLTGPGGTPLGTVPPGWGGPPSAAGPVGANRPVTDAVPAPRPPVDGPPGGSPSTVTPPIQGYARPGPSGFGQPPAAGAAPAYPDSGPSAPGYPASPYQQLPGGPAYPAASPQQPAYQQYPPPPYPRPPAYPQSSPFAQAPVTGVPVTAVPVTAAPGAGAPVTGVSSSGGYGPPAYPPLAPYQHYFPQGRPPRRRRTTLTVTLVVVAALLLCGGVGAAAVAVIRDAAGSGPATADAGATPKRTSAKGDPATLNGALRNQAAALLKGDEKGWLALIDPHATSAVAAYKRIYHNMRAMHVTVWKQSSETGDDITDSESSYDIDVQYCLVATTCTDTEAELHVTAVKRHGKALIVGYSAPQASAYTSEPYPWEVSTLSALTGPRVVVAASSAWSGLLHTALPIATRAAAAADRYAHWGRPPVYVVYLAGSSEGKKWFDGGLRNADGVSFTIAPHDIEIVVMLPDANETQYAGPGRLNTVIQHEMGHVATLQGDHRDHGHDSFIEGIAEYCAYTGHTSWAVYRLEDVRSYVRSGKWSGSIYLTSEITSKNVLTGSAAYGIGYLGLRYLVTTYGLTKMLDFWGAVERDGKSLAAASAQVFDRSWRSVNASAASYVRHAVGL